jgi:urease accessory protein
MVQKPFYPEGPAVCHTVIVHPPGGIVGGDELEVTMHLREGSAVLVTMPGAAKWYRSPHAFAAQRLKLAVGPGAMLEWLPPETIVYNGARAKLQTGVTIEPGGSYLGWEILCLGRTASGEKFMNGEILQRTDLAFADEPAWSERCVLQGGSPLLESAVGLHGAPVSALLIAAGKEVPTEVVAQCRAVGIDDGARSGISAFDRMLIARYIGCSCEEAKNYFIALRKLLRPFLCGRAAVEPRIWNT